MDIPTILLGSSADSRVGVVWSASATKRKEVSGLSADQAKLIRRFKKLTMRSHICRKFQICRPISFTIIGFYELGMLTGNDSPSTLLGGSQKGIVIAKALNKKRRYQGENQESAESDRVPCAFCKAQKHPSEIYRGAKEGLWTCESCRTSPVVLRTGPRRKDIYEQLYDNRISGERESPA